MLSLFSERKGVHWKTQHDISTGEVCLTAEEFIAIHNMMMWVYTFDDCNENVCYPSSCYLMCLCPDPEAGVAKTLAHIHQ